MSKKSITIALPATTQRAELAASAGSEEWVREAGGGAGAEKSAPVREPMAVQWGKPLLLDLSAERSLFEVLALSALVPFALGWFWLEHAMTGRMRF